ncbi:hypothetical protein DIPPA_24012 [Diplonema papillatum]|nr:hypothetical protein DIPPA_24012 [Diplonema papillatum]
MAVTTLALTGWWLCTTPPDGGDYDASRCDAPVGTFGGVSEVNIGAVCNRGWVALEIGHAPGLGHGHDRDEHVSYVGERVVDEPQASLAAELDDSASMPEGSSDSAKTFSFSSSFAATISDVPVATCSVVVQVATGPTVVPTTDAPSTAVPQYSQCLMDAGSAPPPPPQGSSALFRPFGNCLFRPACCAVLYDDRNPGYSRCLPNTRVTDDERPCTYHDAVLTHPRPPLFTLSDGPPQPPNLPTPAGSVSNFSCAPAHLLIFHAEQASVMANPPETAHPSPPGANGRYEHGHRGSFPAVGCREDRPRTRPSTITAADTVWSPQDQHCLVNAVDTPHLPCLPQPPRSVLRSQTARQRRLRRAADRRRGARALSIFLAWLDSPGTVVQGSQLSAIAPTMAAPIPTPASRPPSAPPAPPGPSSLLPPTSISQPAPALGAPVLTLIPTPTPHATTPAPCEQLPEGPDCDLQPDKGLVPPSHTLTLWMGELAVRAKLFPVHSLFPVGLLVVSLLSRRLVGTLCRLLRSPLNETTTRLGSFGCLFWLLLALYFLADIWLRLRSQDWGGLSPRRNGFDAPPNMAPVHATLTCFATPLPKRPASAPSATFMVIGNDNRRHCVTASLHARLYDVLVSRGLIAGPTDRVIRGCGGPVPLDKTLGEIGFTAGLGGSLSVCPRLLGGYRQSRREPDDYVPRAVHSSPSQGDSRGHGGNSRRRNQPRPAQLPQHDADNRCGADRRPYLDRGATSAPHTRQRTTDPVLAGNAGPVHPPKTAVHSVQQPRPFVAGWEEEEVELKATVLLRDLDDYEQRETATRALTENVSLAMRMYVRACVGRNITTGFRGAKKLPLFTKGAYLETYEVSFGVPKSSLDSVLASTFATGIYLSVSEEARQEYTEIMLGDSASLSEAIQWHETLGHRSRGVVQCRGDYGIRVVKADGDKVIGLMFPDGKVEVGYFLVEGVPSRTVADTLAQKLSSAGWPVVPLFQKRRGALTADWVVKSEKHPAVDSYVRNGVTLRFRHTPRPPLEQAKLKGGEPPAAHSPEAPDTTAYPDPLSDSLVKRPRAYFDLMYGDRAANAWRKAAEAAGAPDEDINETPLEGGRSVGQEVPPAPPPCSQSASPLPAPTVNPQPMPSDPRITNLEQTIAGLAASVQQIFGAMQTQMQQTAHHPAPQPAVVPSQDSVVSQSPPQQTQGSVSGSSQSTAEARRDPPAERPATPNPHKDRDPRPGNRNRADKPRRNSCNSDNFRGRSAGRGRPLA